MKLSVIIMAAASTIVLAGGGKPEQSWLCKKCDIYSLEHCEKDVCKDKLENGEVQGPEWQKCFYDCGTNDVCKYVPAGETKPCGRCTHAPCDMWA